jgi:hypothetical protein
MNPAPNSSRSISRPTVDNCRARGWRRAQRKVAAIRSRAASDSQTMIATYAASSHACEVTARHIRSSSLKVVSIARTWRTNCWLVPKSVMFPNATSAV